MKTRSLRIAGLTLGSFILGALSMASFAVSTGYFDVDSNAWYSSAVQYVSDAGLMNGPGDGSFRPSDPVNRAQLAEVLRRVHENGPLAVEYAAQRKAATLALQGSGWSDYKAQLARFPIEGIHYEGPDTVKFEDVVNDLFIAHSDNGLDVLRPTSTAEFFFVRNGHQIYGPFYDDVDRVLSELPTE